MRIGLVCLHTSPLTEPGSGDAGGMNIVVRHQAIELAALGHRVEVFTRRQSLDTASVTQVSPGLTVHQVDAGPPRMLPKSRQHEHIEAFSAALAARGPAGSAPFDVLHSHHWMSGLAALPVARSWGVPHLQSYHSIAAAPRPGAEDDLSLGEPAETPQRPPGERRLARESDRVVAISRAEAASAEALGAPAERVTVVPPGVDRRVFYPLPTGRPPSPGYLLAAARLQPLKGLDLAVRALALVDPAVRPRLVLAGDSSEDFDDYAHDLRNLVSDQGLTDSVDFIGSRARDDLATLLRSARLCLIPSHSETFGLIALEAAASGVPVLAANSGGLGEAVADGRSGLVLTGRDPHTWAAAISRLMTDHGWAATLASGALAWAATFTWRRTAELLAEVYADTVAGPRSPDQHPGKVAR